MAVGGGHRAREPSSQQTTARGADPVGNTPEQFGDYRKKDIDRWAKPAKTTNIKVD